MSSDTTAPKPIFLHSSFRTGSTWLWQKLRASKHTLAYYEVFNEVLETCTFAQAKSLDYSGWNSRHPVASPYFLEFLPFLKPEGGVIGFSRAMAYNAFIPESGPDGDLSPEEVSYIDCLIAAANTNKKIPVLSCTRSLGRARAIRQAFGGQTVFVHRNLFHQWASYCGQLETGDPSFIESISKTICGSLHDPFIRNIAEWFDIRNSHQPNEELFQVFMLLHLYLYGIVFDVSDLVIDTTAVASDIGLRHTAESRLSDMTCGLVDLSDIRQNFETSLFVAKSPRAMRDTLEQFTKMIPARLLSPTAVNFVDEMKTRALVEYDRFEFYNRGFRSISSSRLDAATARLDLEVRRADELTITNEQLRRELSNLADTLDTERAEHTEALKTLAQAQTLLIAQPSMLEIDGKPIASKTDEPLASQAQFEHVGQLDYDDGASRDQRLEAAEDC